MRKMFTILLLFGSTLSVFPQEQKVYFDDAINEHLKSYNAQCDRALINDHVEYVDVLFDSLKKTYLKGTLISNFRLRKISGGYIDTDDIKTPILLITKKTCIVTNREEIRAINEMANQYKGKLEFILLYWDKKRLAKKATKAYNKNVTVVYVNERDNKLDMSLSSIKNSFGVPASFYITENKELSNIDRKFFLKNLKKSTKKEFMENTYKDITQLLLENETKKKATNISISGNK
ncbi:MAG: hypothetical protein R2783_05980 [Gelidibacter sp.]